MAEQELLIRAMLEYLRRLKGFNEQEFRSIISSFDAADGVIDGKLKKTIPEKPAQRR